MKKETRNQITFALVGVVVVILLFLGYGYINKPEIPVVGTSGEISGYYAIGGIMRLERPYVCSFEKTDGASKILGVIHTDGENLYGEFKIQTDSVEGKFNSFLMIKNKTAYTWTSLQNIGYKSNVAKSATKNASPQEQAQIVGTRDKMNYECSPWPKVDPTLFEIPNWIEFADLR